MAHTVLAAEEAGKRGGKQSQLLGDNLQLIIRRFLRVSGRELIPLSALGDITEPTGYVRGWIWLMGRKLDTSANASIPARAFSAMTLPSRYNFIRRVDIFSGSHHRNIFTGLAFVSTFIVIAKLFGALKEVAVAARYGTGPAVDAYVYVFNLLSWPLAVWVSTLGIVLIPLFVRASREQPAQLALFEREFFSLSLTVGALLAVVGGMAITAVLSSSASGLSPDTASYAHWMAAPLALIVPLGYASTLFATQLMVSRRHTNSLFEGIPALCLLITVLTSHDRTGKSLVIGTVAGYIVQFGALILSEPRFLKAASFSLGFSSSLWTEIRRYAFVVILSQLLVSAAGVIDQVMVAHLNGNANAVLGYAARLLALFTGLGATAIGRALLPVLSELRNGYEGRESRIAKHWALILFFIGTATAGLGWIGAQALVHVAFERGAFSPSDTLHVAQVLRFGFLQLPFYFSGVVMAQLVASRAQYSVFLYANAAALVVKVLFNFVFISIMGVKGSALATAFMYATSFTALWLLTAERKTDSASERTVK